MQQCNSFKDAKEKKIDACIKIFDKTNKHDKESFSGLDGRGHFQT